MKIKKIETIIPVPVGIHTHAVYVEILEGHQHTRKTIKCTREECTEMRHMYATTGSIMIDGYVHRPFMLEVYEIKGIWHKNTSPRLEDLGDE